MTTTTGEVLLESEYLIIHSGTIGKYVVRDHFQLNSNSGLLPISRMEESFEYRFMGKTEPPSEAGGIETFKLLHPASDTEIIRMLGGEEKAELSMGKVYCVLSGKYLDQGVDHVFYVRSVEGEFSVIVATWFSRSWILKGTGILGNILRKEGTKIHSSKHA